jgi:hypothetical protein
LLGLKRKQEDFCAAECAGDKETFDSVLNLKHIIQALKFLLPTQKLLLLTNFPPFSCGPLVTWRASLSSRMARLKNH